MSTPDTRAAIIAVDGLAKDYRVGSTLVHALRGVDLQIRPGEFVALMGASGSGKSTLMHLLGCLETPTAGTYRLEGRDIGRASRDERAHIRNTRIGFVFQAFNLLPRFTALDNVALPLLYRGRSRDARARAAAALERVGMAQRAAHRPTELSGGEKQRVAIARALVTGPAIVLADEPTGSLDSATGSEIMRLLVAVAEQDCTILMVTHDARVAAYAGRTLTMHDGRIVHEGASDVLEG